MKMKKLEVVAAIVWKNNQILSAQRGDSKYEYIKYRHEFPGGKIEQDETHEETLKRELKEELNIEVVIQEHLTTVNYIYPDFEVKMHVYECMMISNNITLNEHVGYEWSKVGELENLKWLDADIQIIDLLKNKYK
tara:strand:+ start:121 stop:525 length:405 start_codon:yes stop_codon:yes gene_type:complete